MGIDMKNILITILIALLVSYTVTTFVQPKTTLAPKNLKESTYDRVIRTGIIRCGYGLWQPALMKDPNTGKLSGIYYDYLEQLGHELGLKIEWAQELDLSTYLQDLNNGRIDLECSGGWPNAFRGKFVDYTTPIYFNPVYMYARKGFKVDPEHLDALNRPDVRFSVQEGETSAIYRAKIWPKTTVYTTLGSAPIMEYIAALAYNKADVALCDQMSMKPWMAQNPGAVYRVSDKPVFFIANNMSVPAGETRFLNMLNTATQQMLYSGDIERILKKYNVEPIEALRVALPYQTP